jgi:branched-chain amino acid transport system ATP-binding protein
VILEVENIETFYGLSHILFGVSLKVKIGETVCLLGRNGSGKTTFLKSVMGIVPAQSGKIIFKGNDITNAATHNIARAGIGLVPEDRRIFSDLTVRENLEIAIKKNSGGSNVNWTTEKIYGLFPVLGKRKNQAGDTLSGGEQQMLAIARCLMGNPELLFLDEPSEGLAPIIVQSLGDQLDELKKEGITMLLTEHGEALASRLGEKAYLLEKGHIAWEGTMQQLKANEKIRIRYLGV